VGPDLSGHHDTARPIEFGPTSDHSRDLSVSLGEHERHQQPAADTSQQRADAGVGKALARAL